MSLDDKSRCGIFPLSTDLGRSLVNKLRAAVGKNPIDGPDPFQMACEAHDNAYVLQLDSRKEVDERFLRAMWKISQNGRHMDRAEVYYWLVRWVGWIPWYARKFGLIR